MCFRSEFLSKHTKFRIIWLEIRRTTCVDHGLPQYALQVAACGTLQLTPQTKYFDLVSEITQTILKVPESCIEAIEMCTESSAFESPWLQVVPIHAHTVRPSMHL